MLRIKPGAGGGQAAQSMGVRLADARARLPGLPHGNGTAGRLRWECLGG
jgi:hypothetical protein